MHKTNINVDLHFTKHLTFNTFVHIKSHFKHTPTLNTIRTLIYINTANINIQLHFTDLEHKHNAYAVTQATLTNINTGHINKHLHKQHCKHLRRQHKQAIIQAT